MRELTIQAGILNETPFGVQLTADPDSDAICAGLENPDTPEADQSGVKIPTLQSPEKLEPFAQMH